MPRVLRTDVHVAGRIFAAGTTPPDAYARLITNPAAWESDAQFALEQLAADNPDLMEVIADVTAPLSNNNDTAQIGEETTVIAAPPTGPSGGPEPRPGPSTPPRPDDAAPQGEQGEPDQDPDDDEDLRLQAPPRSGKGSGVDAWSAFAAVHGVHPHPGADRAAIIAACEHAGLIPEA